MTYKEYCESMKDVQISNELEYRQAIMWLHPETLPLGLVSIGNSGLSIIKVPEKATNRFGRTVPVICIAKEAFSGNKTVTDIILPPSIERLPSGAFSGCSSLENITIPRRIKAIKEKTFDGCCNLVNVFYEGTPDEWDNINIIHEKHEIEFGDCVPGTPIATILSERRINIPGNEALFSSNIHFRCNLGTMGSESSFRITAGGKDITDLFRPKM